MCEVRENKALAKISEFTEGFYRLTCSPNEPAIPNEVLIRPYFVLTASPKIDSMVQDYNVSLKLSTYLV